MKLRVQYALELAFGTALATVLYIGASNYVHLHREQMDLAEIAEIDTTIGDLNDIILFATTTQSATRRYLIDLAPAMLAQRSFAEAQLRAQLADLDVRTLRTPRGPQQRDELRQRANAVLDWQHRLLTAEAEQGVGAARQLISSGHGDELMQSLRQVANSLDTAEKGIRYERWRVTQLDETRAHAFSIVLFAVVVVLLIISYVLVRQHFAIRQRIEYALTRRVKERGVQLATIGAKLELATDKQRQTEAARRDAEARFRALIEQAGDAMIVHDREGQIVDANQLACSTLGYTRSRLLHMNIAEVRKISSDDGTDLPWDSICPGAPVTLTGAHRRRDGASFPVELRIGCHDFGDHRLYIGIARDISERQRIESALAQYAAIVESSPDALTSVDLDWKFITWNPAAERLLGFTASEVIGRPINVVLNKQVDEIRKVRERVDRGESVGPFETVRRHKDGHLVHVTLTVSPVRAPNGRVLGAAAILHDISNRRRLEAEVVRVRDHEQQRFGHDLHDGVGQQLTAIELMLHQVAEEAEAKSNVRVAKIEKIGELLRRTIKDVRALSHGLSPYLVDSGGLQSALERLVEAAGSARCHLVCPASLPDIKADVAMQLYRIAQEAFNNAIKHSGATKIEIRLLTDEERLHLQISDNGSGRPDTEQFVSGVGLQSMRYRADLIGADFSVQSSPSGGVTVSCTLPIS